MFNLPYLFPHDETFFGALHQFKPTVTCFQLKTGLSTLPSMINK